MELNEPSAKYLVQAVYKQTEGGLIPMDWSYQQLTDVARLESGHTPSRRQPSYWGGDIPWISLHDTGSLNDLEILATQQYISQAGLKNSSARLLPKGTVVLSRTATVGKATSMGREMATSQDFANYVCGPAVDSHFLVYLFRYMAPEWRKLMAGSIHNTVYMPTFKSLRVVLPPKREQESIAQALQDADALIESLEQLLAKKRKVKQGAMQELLSGQLRLHGFEGEWVKVAFGDVAEPRRERVIPAQIAGTTLCVELEHIQPGTGCLQGVAFESKQAAIKTVFAKGDVLFGKLRAYLRKYWMAEFSGVCSTEIWALKSRGKLGSNAYLFYLVQQDKFIEAASSTYGTHMPRSDWNVVSTLRIEIPESIDEQNAVASILSDMDTEITALEARLTKARQLKQGMAQALLTGRIRLV